MNLPDVTTREQWLAERKDLLRREKELTRMRDQMNADRRRLPMVLVEKDYVFQGPEGPAHLLDLFGDSRQLVVKHFMFDPRWESGCAGCTADVDEMSEGLFEHLRSRDTALAIVSRAPKAKLDAYAEERGWSIAFYSSFDSDFNYDFGVTLDAAVTPVMFNYRNEAELREAGLGWAVDEAPMEQPGVSSFLREGGHVYHTYSTFARGTEYLGSSYALLDLTALGRQEEWEEPKGRVERPHEADPGFTG
jgi:predicted dithiol-disulfide oxidoreductase (DUF899 family)